VSNCICEFDLNKEKARLEHMIIHTFSSRPMKCDGSKHTTLQECVYCKVGAKLGQTP